MALIAEDSGYAFDSYVNILYSVPRRVCELTGITNGTLQTLGLPFRDVMNGLIEFLQHEQAHSDTIPIIIVLAAVGWGCLEASVQSFDENTTIIII